MREQRRYDRNKVYTLRVQSWLWRRPECTSAWPVLRGDALREGHPGLDPGGPARGWRRAGDAVRRRAGRSAHHAAVEHDVGGGLRAAVLLLLHTGEDIVVQDSCSRAETRREKCICLFGALNNLQ